MYEDAKKRRSLLLGRDQQLAQAGMGCADCTGVCCTYVANSVCVTELEARDIYSYLEREGKLDAAMVRSWKETIRKNGLDRPPAGNGRRTFSRKRYTCSFFTQKSLGCPLPKFIKPYGCLGFNPSAKGVTAGVGCASQQDLLREQQTCNGGLREETWPLPVALMRLYAGASSHL